MPSWMELTFTCGKCFWATASLTTGASKSGTGPDLDDLKHEVASKVAGQWETCEIDEKA